LAAPGGEENSGRPKLFGVTNNSKTKKKIKKNKATNKTIHFFSDRRKNVIIAVIESRIALDFGRPLFWSNRTVWRKRKRGQKESKRNIMNGCHLVPGRSRIDR
jgi:hypothetical protein